MVKVTVLVWGVVLASGVFHFGWALPNTATAILGASPSGDFAVPDGLRPAVGFWKKVFSEYDRGTLVLHDRDNLDVIWQVVKLPQDKHGQVKARAASRTARAAQRKLEARLKRLYRKKTPKDALDQALLDTAHAHDVSLKHSWKRVRAQQGVADNFERGLQRAQKWAPKIREILAKAGAPEELVALPFIESMFNPSARSFAGASGLWQLMPATARGLGLTVNRRRDERSDVHKATHAAAKMLKQNHDMLGSWPLAITGYNHGPYGIKRAVEEVGSSDLMTLIEHYDGDTWGFASKNFYAEFVAALEVLRAYEAEHQAAASNAEPSPHEG